MAPQIALNLALVGIVALLWLDIRQKPAMGAALWIPVAWFCIGSSRFVSQWMALLGIGGGPGAASLEDGSPIDAVVFLGLIVLGAIVLTRRKVRVSEFVRNNGWLTVFFAYCFLAIFWSDFPFVAFKRWIKILGHPVMALVLLTADEPAEAIKRALKRSAYVVVPLSIVFIKYFPDLGRGFDSWTGLAYDRGVTLNKNELGYGCLIYGLFFSWNLLSTWSSRYDKWLKRQQACLSIAFLLMVLWLLSRAGSATSLACFLIGVATIVIVSTPLVSKRFLGSYIVMLLVIAGIAELTFGLRAGVIDALGRDSTLTDRTKLWADIFAIDINPLFGAGFESFWLGTRLDILWAKWWWHPNQAHNGYIETYLNLGWVGIALLGILVIATFRKIRWALLRDLDLGRFRLAFLFAVVAYNYTEAAFKGVHLVWTLFHLIAIDYPRITDHSSEQTAMPAVGGTKMPVATAVPAFRPRNLDSRRSSGRRARPGSQGQS